VFLFQLSQAFCNATYYGTVTSIHDARRFRLDLIKELLRLQSPQYPQRAFWRALEVADHADVVRAITAVNASEDAYYFDRSKAARLRIWTTSTPGIWLRAIRPRKLPLAERTHTV
jgi:hypothetical protein